MQNRRENRKKAVVARGCYSERFSMPFPRKLRSDCSEIRSIHNRLLSSGQSNFEKSFKESLQKQFYYERKILLVCTYVI